METVDYSFSMCARDFHPKSVMFMTEKVFELCYTSAYRCGLTILGYYALPLTLSY